MKLGILANPHLRECEPLVKELLDIIGDWADVIIEEELAKKLGMQGTLLEEMDVDVLITIGGDGTILHALQKANPIIAGINAGQLGFLTEIPKETMKTFIARILEEEYEVETRLRLKVMLNGDRLPDCLNEAVLHTSHVSKMHHFEVLVGGNPAMNVRADGLIVSTPTGSTSYAMSVGGPIIDPNVNVFVMAPIAPFNLAIRPLVIPADSDIEVRHVTKKPCVLVLDGQEEYNVLPQDVLQLGSSENPARFVKFEGNFYEKAWKKLRM